MACSADYQGYAIKIFGMLLVPFFVLSSGAWAAGLTISPVMIELESPRKAIAVTLTNGGGTTLTFQSRVLIWEQVDGLDRFTPTDAVLVAPAIIDIPPNSSQVFRIALRRTDPQPTEQSFRLLLEDVSRPESGDGKPAVALRLIHSLPLFVAPNGKPVMGLRWRPCETSDTANCIRISNVGNRHMKVRSVTIAGDRWQRSVDQPRMLLAGSWREWTFDLDPSESSITKIVVQNDREVLVAMRDTPEIPKDTITVIASGISDTAPCTPQTLEATVHAQALFPDSGTPVAADRNVVLPSCTTGTRADSR